MLDCPTDAALARMIDDAMSADDQSALEAHLSNCGSCRQRIDTLGAVAAMSAMAGSTRMAPPAESPSLRLVMEQLLSESQMLGRSANFAAKASREVLPVLQPTARPGFIGRLGEIDVRKVIGRGGMGVVFEGVDRVLNRTVAIKVLSPHLVGDGDAKTRFLREAQAAAALTHENVVAIHAIDEADGMPYLVLQFVSGESLAERLARDKTLPFADVVRIGMQTARGLAAAHKQGLIHRDIKPANILLEAATGDVRITDFGLAKRGGFDSITEVGIIAGTPAYMSPEQAVDGDLDARSDLFSLGVVLYEASTGVSPFAADSPFVILNKIGTHRPRPVCEVNPELPEWFGAIVDRLLQKKPEHRIGSAAELAQLLDRQTALAPAKTTGPFGSRRRLLGWALVVLIGSSIGMAISFRMADRPSSPLNPAAAPPIVGFVVSGVAEPFPTLAAAVQAALDNSVIDVHGDGPFATPTIALGDKALTIRAAPGFAPRFVPDVTGEKGPPQFLKTSGDLRLEGLEVIWPIPTQQKRFDDLGQHAVIGQGKGKLSVSYCRIVSGTSGVCVGFSGRDVDIEHTHLVAPAGACLAWRSNAANVRVEQCVLEGKIALFTATLGAGGPTTAIQFTANSVVAPRVLNLIVMNPIGKSMRIAATRNLIDSNVVVGFNSLGGFQPGANAKMTDLLREAIVWKDESNVYRQGCVYLAGNPRNQPHGVLPSSLNAIDRWQSFWKPPGSNSIEGIIRFRDRVGSAETAPPQLSGIEAATGPLPTEFGANLATLGPGPAYQAGLSKADRR